MSRRACLGALAVAAASELTAAADAEPLWSAEYWAHKGSARLYMFRKRAGAPVKGGTPRPVLFMVHGSSISARPSFDLTVPGRGQYSIMDVFARFGFDVWTMDHEGYGHSSPAAGNADIACGAADLAAAMEVVTHESGQPRASFFGSSSGALRAATFSMLCPQQVERLALEAFTWTGKGSATLEKRGAQADFFRTHNRRPRGRDMIMSIFTRDHADAYDMAAANALADAELKFGDTVPTGTYLDMTVNLPVVDPSKVLCPVLIVKGEYDGIASLDDLLGFFQRLPNPDRQFVIVPGAAHAVMWSKARARVWTALRAFLEVDTSRGPGAHYR